MKLKEKLRQAWTTIKTWFFHILYGTILLVVVAAIYFLDKVRFVF